MEVKLHLKCTVYNPKKMVSFELPQIVLCGRSNVGKSSLLNCLAKNKKLAKTSSTPGKTRSVNFFIASEHNFYFVDLPGYGYAACSKEERKKWPILVKSYFEKNLSYIKGIILLLDSKVEPQSSDLQLLSFLENTYPNRFDILPVLTKVDRCKRSQLEKNKRLWEKAWNFKRPFIEFSAKTGTGVKNLWKAILDLIKGSS